MLNAGKQLRSESHMRTKIKVTEEGVVVPKEFFTDVEEVEIWKKYQDKNIR